MRRRAAARLVFEVQTTAERAMREFAFAEGCTMHTPKLVGTASESGAEVFEVGYLDCFRYGCPPHGGFGLGLGRLLMVLPGLDSIRDASFLFRGPNRLTPRLRGCPRVTGSIDCLRTGTGNSDRAPRPRPAP